MKSQNTSDGKDAIVEIETHVRKMLDVQINTFQCDYLHADKTNIKVMRKHIASRVQSSSLLMNHSS